MACRICSIKFAEAGTIVAEGGLEQANFVAAARMSWVEHVSISLRSSMSARCAFFRIGMAIRGIAATSSPDDVRARLAQRGPFKRPRRVGERKAETRRLGRAGGSGPSGCAPLHPTYKGIMAGQPLRLHVSLRQGSMRSRPVLAKSSMLRVASAQPLASAMAAIKASGTVIGRPARRVMARIRP